jgi:hypothetical protein
MSGCFSVLSENVEHTSEYKDGQTKQRKNGKKTTVYKTSNTHKYESQSQRMKVIPETGRAH